MDWSGQDFQYVSPPVAPVEVGFSFTNVYIYLEEFGSIPYRGDRGINNIENIQVGEFSDRSRVDVLEDCLVEKLFSDLTWDKSVGLEGRKILGDDTKAKVK